MMVRHVCNYTPSLLHSFPSQKSKQMVDANTLAFLSLSLSFFLFFFFGRISGFLSWCSPGPFIHFQEMETEVKILLTHKYQILSPPTA